MVRYADAFGNVFKRQSPVTHHHYDVRCTHPTTGCNPCNEAAAAVVAIRQQDLNRSRRRRRRLVRLSSPDRRACVPPSGSSRMVGRRRHRQRCLWLLPGPRSRSSRLGLWTVTQTRRSEPCSRPETVRDWSLRSPSVKLAVLQPEDVAIRRSALSDQHSVATLPGHGYRGELLPGRWVALLKSRSRLV